MVDGRIKVLITASTFPRYDNDTEPRFILDLAEALQEYCDVTVLVPSAPGACPREVLNGVQVIRYRYFPIKRLETLCYPGAIVPRIKQKKSRALLVPFMLVSLWFHIRKYESQYDVVNPHWIIPQGVVQSFCRKKYLITGHGADVVSLNKGPIAWLKARCLDRASGVTVVSTRLKEYLEQHYGLENVQVCPMGCRLHVFSPVHGCGNYFGQGNKKVVLFVGRLAEKKGVRYLIEAMQKVEARLVIIGTGPLEQELKKQAEKTKADIQFWGNKSHGELRIIMPSADLFVVPSVTAAGGDTEGIPVSIMEAMASGVPVVASDSGGIADLVKHRENGLLTKEKDVEGIAEAINMLLSNQELAGKLSKRAMETIKEYDYKEIALKYYGMYQRIVEQ